MILKNQIVRYLIAGTSSAMTQLLFTYVLTHYLHLYYISSSCLGFTVAFMVSFLLQKFWTFQDYSQDRSHIQVPVYLGVAIIGLSLNTALLYALVEYVGLWYVLAQFIAMGVVSTSNFFIYKLFIFHKKEEIRE